MKDYTFQSVYGYGYSLDLDKPVRKELMESIKNEGIVLYEKV